MDRLGQRWFPRLLILAVLGASISICAASVGDTTADRELGQGDFMHNTSPQLRAGVLGQGSSGLNFSASGCNSDGLSADSTVRSGRRRRRRGLRPGQFGGQLQR